MTGLLAAVVGLLVINLIFAATVVLLRIRSNYRSTRFDRIEAVWDPVIVGVVGGDDPTAIHIPDDEADHVLEICGRFARRLKGPDRRRVQTLAAPLLDRLVPDLEASSPETRGAAVELLGVLGIDSRRNHLVSALDDPSPRVSLVAARALLAPESSVYLPAVLEHLHRYTNWSPSLMSAMLAHTGTGALDDLRRYFGDPNRPTHARAVVASSLRLLRDPQSAEIAAKTLVSDDPELVVASLRLIASVGSSKQIIEVRRLLGHPAFFVRAEAVSVIGHIGTDKDVEAVVGMTGDDSPWVTIHATRALLDLGQRSALETLSAGNGQAAEGAREVLQQAGAR